MEVLGNGISPTDIKQGLLGDCYFMSALSSLAEKSYIVERMFSTDGPVCAPEYCEQGFYWVNFYKNGEWHRVTVDDYFPCSVNGGPIFSTSNGGLWVLLIEKAYAKLHGSYWALRSG
jgi:calpain-15